MPAPPNVTRGKYAARSAFETCMSWLPGRYTTGFASASALSSRTTAAFFLARTISRIVTGTSSTGQTHRSKRSPRTTTSRTSSRLRRPFKNAANARAFVASSQSYA